MNEETAKTGNDYIKAILTQSALNWDDQKRYRAIAEDIAKTENVRIGEGNNIELLRADIKHVQGENQRLKYIISQETRMSSKWWYKLFSKFYVTTR
jgi:hypothetical protein